MNIIEALAELESSGIETVTHFQGETHSLSQLIGDIRNATNDGADLDDTSDRGEWCVDASGIEQLDASGYRTGNRYNAKAA